MHTLLEPSPTFQTELDALAPGAHVRLLPVEYAGPVVIRKPVVLDGQGATIWALRGPVLAIASDRVRLSNLRVEMTGTHGIHTENGIALLHCGKDGTLERVTVRGGVRGLVGEDGTWRLPEVLEAGRLEPGEEHILKLRIYVPRGCRLESSVAGVEIDPAELLAGANEVRLHVEALPPDTLLHGSLNVMTPCLWRAISFVAHILPGAGDLRSDYVWQPADWDELVRAARPAEPTSLVLSVPAAPAPAPVPLTRAKPAVPPPPVTVVIPGALPGAIPAQLPVTQATAAPAQPATNRRTVTGPLVSNVFQTPPPAPAAPQPATAEPVPPAAPAAPVRVGRPGMRMKPVSRLFDQNKSESAQPDAVAEPPETQEPNSGTTKKGET